MAPRSVPKHIERTNNLANIGHQDIDTLGKVLVTLNLLHVETLQMFREVHKENWNIQHIGHLSFGSFSDIVTDLVMTWCDVGIIILEENVVFVEEGDGILVVETLEWSSRSLKTRVEFLNKLAGDGIGENHVDNFTDLRSYQRMKAEEQTSYLPWSQCGPSGL